MSDTIGDKSTLFLLFTFQATPADSSAGLVTDWLQRADSALRAASLWEPRDINRSELLPHLNEVLAQRHADPERPLDLAEGALLARYVLGRTKSRLAATSWSLTPERRSPIGFSVSDIELYLSETGHAFLVAGVRPSQQDLDGFLDLVNVHLRGRDASLAVDPEASPQIKDQFASFLTGHRGNAQRSSGSSTGSRPTLRDFLYHALLAPALGSAPLDWLRLAPPRGIRPQPQGVSVVFTDGLPDGTTLHRLRLAQSSRQSVSPAPADTELDSHPSAFRPSAHELCLVSPLGLAWVVHSDWRNDAFRGGLTHTIRENYINKWILVSLQRLQLLDISTECARRSTQEDNFEQLCTAFKDLQRRLLVFSGRYYFSQLSDEERHARFYAGLRRALDLPALYAEVKEEIGEFNQYLDARRTEEEARRSREEIARREEERVRLMHREREETLRREAIASEERQRDRSLNQVIAFLTFVLTPTGIVVGIFQVDTLPLGWKVTLGIGEANKATGVASLFHPPFWILIVLMTVGALLFRKFTRTAPQTSDGAQQLFDTDSSRK